MGAAAPKTPPQEEALDRLRGEMERTRRQVEVLLQIAESYDQLARLVHRGGGNGRAVLSKIDETLANARESIDWLRALASRVSGRAPELAFSSRRAAEEADASATRLAQQRYEAEWQFWYERLSEEKRRTYADKARAAGYEAPESFEAARRVVEGEFIASQMTPEELADLASGADLAPERCMSLDEFERELAALGG